MPTTPPSPGWNLAVVPVVLVLLRLPAHARMVRAFLAGSHPR